MHAGPVTLTEEVGFVPVLSGGLGNVRSPCGGVSSYSGGEEAHGVVGGQRNVGMSCMYHSFKKVIEHSQNAEAHVYFIPNRGISK